LNRFLAWGAVTSQSQVTSAPRDPPPSSGLPGHLHLCSLTQKHADKNKILKKNLKKLKIKNKEKPAFSSPLLSHPPSSAKFQGTRTTENQLFMWNQQKPIQRAIMKQFYLLQKLKGGKNVHKRISLEPSRRKIYTRKATNHRKMNMPPNCPLPNRSLYVSEVLSLKKKKKGETGTIVADRGK